jgi:hypothetical protein
MSIFKYFSRANLRFNIHNLSYLPRWIIVLIDISVLIMAFSLTYLIFNGTGLDYIITTHVLTFIGLFFGINLHRCREDFVLANVGVGILLVF